MPLSAITRPLTVPEDEFAVRFDVGLTQVASEQPMAIVEAGTGFGYAERAEVGVILLRLSMSPARDSGLDDPVVFGRVRFSDGPLQVGLFASSEVPVSPGTYQAVLGPEARLVIAETVAFDLRPKVRLIASDGYTIALAVPLAFEVQLGPRVHVAVQGELRRPDLRARAPWLLVPSARVAYTFGGPAAVVELAGALYGPEVPVRGETLPDPRLGNYVAGFVEVRWFVPFQPAHRFEPL